MNLLKIKIKIINVSGEIEIDLFSNKESAMVKW